MRVALLFSGGKDSAFAAWAARLLGHDVAVLLTVLPHSAESRLLHHPNARWTRLQAESMGIPQLAAPSASDETDAEQRLLSGLLESAAREHGIRGVVHGGIRSGFQGDRFAAACGGLGLEPLAPLWGAEPGEYMEGLLDSGFEFVITSVSAGGLDGSWLGRRVARQDLRELAALSERHGFNLDFEGGEAETFVTDCPLFSRPVEILRHEGGWDGYRGRFEIVGARLGQRCLTG